MFLHMKSHQQASGCVPVSDMASTVDILTMHNAGPQLFLCIVRFYARSNVSHSVTICHLCQKSHASNMVSIFMGEKLLPKKELREVCQGELLEQYSLSPSRGFCFFRSRSSCHFLSAKFYLSCFGFQICNFEQGSQQNLPKLDGKVLKYLATILKSIFVAQREY